MQSVSVFLDIAKIADFQLKNADVSRTHRMCHVIHIFRSSLGKVYNCVKFHHYRICVTDFREGAFLAPPIHASWAATKKPILNRIKNKNEGIQ